MASIIFYCMFPSSLVVLENVNVDVLTVEHAVSKSEVVNPNEFFGYLIEWPINRHGVVGKLPRKMVRFALSQEYPPGHGTL